MPKSSDDDRKKSRKRSKQVDSSDEEARTSDKHGGKSRRKEKSKLEEEQHRENRKRSKKATSRSSPVDSGDDQKHRRRRRGSNDEAAKTPTVEKEVVKKNVALADDVLQTRTGGAYIPPGKLRLLQAQITDKSSAAYQRISWEALKKSLHGLINKVNASNIKNIVRELFQENLIRGRGLLTRSLIVAQGASITFTHVYAALVSVINTRFPAIAELVLKRLITDFKKSFKRNNKIKCLSGTQFIAHLVNQQVAHEIVALEILALLLEQPTDDSVEVAIGFLKECGARLSELSPRGMNGLFDRLRSVLNEAMIDKRVQYMIEVMFQVRRDGFKDNPAIVAELDLVNEDDQFTHMMTLEEDYDVENGTNVFKFDPEYVANEEKYLAIKREILGDDESGDEDGNSSSGSEDDSDEEGGESGNDEEAATNQTIVDNTETNLLKLRRTIYLVIQSSLDFEEAAHKMLKLEIKPGQEYELCNMVMDCCAQLRTYEKFYGLLGGRFCSINKKYVEEYEKIFAEQYNTIHRLETVKLRNVAKFFGHLLHTDAISWGVLQVIKLNEDDTTSSSRIFIKILMQELCEFMGLAKLNERFKDPTLQVFFEGLFPRGNPRDTRFSINFFTAIGLGGLTVELREFLQQPQVRPGGNEVVGGDSSDDDSSSSSSSDSSDSDSSSDSSDNDKKKKKKKESITKQAENRDRDKDIDSSSKKRYDRDEQDPMSKKRHYRDEDDSRSKKRHYRDEDDLRSNKRHDRDEDDSMSKKRHDRDEDDSRSKKRDDRDEDDSRSKKRHDRDEEDTRSKKRPNRDEDDSMSKKRHDRDEDDSRSKKRHDRDEDVDSKTKKHNSNEKDRERKRGGSTDRHLRRNYSDRKDKGSNRDQDRESSIDRFGRSKRGLKDTSDSRSNKKHQEDDEDRDNHSTRKDKDSRRQGGDRSNKETHDTKCDDIEGKNLIIDDPHVVDYDESDESDNDRRLVRSHVTKLGDVFGDKSKSICIDSLPHSSNNDKTSRSERRHSQDR